MQNQLFGIATNPIFCSMDCEPNRVRKEIDYPIFCSMDCEPNRVRKEIDWNFNLQEFQNSVRRFFFFFSA
jgi:hypothetical protein